LLLCVQRLAYYNLSVASEYAYDTLYLILLSSLETHRNVQFESAVFLVNALVKQEESRTKSRPGHDVKLHPHFHCHWYLFILMCQSAFLYTQLYLSTNLYDILCRNVSWQLALIAFLR